MKSLLCCLWLLFTTNLGVEAGLALTNELLARPAMERYEADCPGKRPCGLFTMPYTCLGLITGLPVGIWFGWWSSRRLFPSWWGFTKADQPHQ